MEELQKASGEAGGLSEYQVGALGHNVLQKQQCPNCKGFDTELISEMDPQGDKFYCNTCQQYFSVEEQNPTAGAAIAQPVRNTGRAPGDTIETLGRKDIQTEIEKESKKRERYDLQDTSDVRMAAGSVDLDDQDLEKIKSEIDKAGGSGNAYAICTASLGAGAQGSDKWDRCIEHVQAQYGKSIKEDNTMVDDLEKRKKEEEEPKEEAEEEVEKMEDEDLSDLDEDEKKAYRKLKSRVKRCKEKGKTESGQNPEEDTASATDANSTISPNQSTPSSAQHMLTPQSSVDASRIGHGQSPSEVSYTGKDIDAELKKSPLGKIVLDLQDKVSKSNKDKEELMKQIKKLADNKKDDSYMKSVKDNVGMEALERGEVEPKSDLTFKGMFKTTHGGK